MIPPGAQGPGFHIHGDSFETFHVLSGKLLVSIVEVQEEHILRKGSIAVVVPGGASIIL